MRLLLPLLFVLASCAPPKNNTPVDQIPKLGSLKEVMDVQATTADPQFKKTDQAAFSAEEYASLSETARKIDATSRRIKDFSMGKDFYTLADLLNGHAATLSKAVEAKDDKGVRDSLQAMKATCKECHSRFR
jgi:cytochrome c556